MNKILVILCLFGLGCRPYIEPVSVVTPVHIIEPGISTPVTIKEEVVPTLYIKDINITQMVTYRAGYRNNTANITFNTTVPSTISIKTLVWEKEFHSIKDTSQSLKHNIWINGLVNGAIYSVVITAYSNNTEDRVVVMFTAMSGTDNTDSSQLQSSYTIDYMPPTHYPGSPQPYWSE